MMKTQFNHTNGSDTPSEDGFNDESGHDLCSTATPPDDSANEEVPLAKNETTAVRVLRVITLLVMVGAAVAVSVLVYLYMKRDEEEALDQNFNDLAHRLMDGFHANAALQVQTMDLLGLSLTASAIATNQTWPMCTFMDFEARATSARAILKSEYIGFYPYVTNETRKEWQAYTVENSGWLNASFDYQDDFKSVHGRTVGSRAPQRALRGMSREDATSIRWLQEEGQLNEEATNDALNATERNATFDAGPDGISADIYRYATPEETDQDLLWVIEPEDAPGPFYPMWQVSPTREYAGLDINYNIVDEYYADAFSAAPEVVRNTQTVVFGGVWNVDETGYVLEDDDYDFRTVPAASVIYPIFDKLTGDKEVVAVFDLDVEFGPLISSVLPSNSNQLLVVIQSTCNQVYSYKVTGETATYLGAEDMHDERFEEMMVSTLLTDFEGSSSIVYNGPPINKDFCPWVINVYATQDMHDAYITSQPIYYMCACLRIFLFTCLVFLMYDCLVEYRQNKVSTVAQRSEKIVSSLFPKSFREQMYENEDKNAKKAKETGPKSFQTSHVQEFLAEGSGELASAASNDISKSPPMAQLYPNCTVFFADVSGFTAWSSARSPTEVFTLLETIYGAFDKLAAKHKVFKIETIGDCYVAVTGLPMAQLGHALQMVRFARDVHVKMKKLTQQLEGVLGPDTAELAMRVGLHSGPVTAGVLRGEKARFQLFGDTVNTAARMESNGQREMIHVSQQTANILIEKGKEHWVHAREDKIHAKGKGELQTYFVKPTSGAGSVLSGYSMSDSSSRGDNDGDIMDIEDALGDLEGAYMQKGVWAANNHKRIGWVSDLLKEQLKRMVSQRNTTKVDPSTWQDDGSKDHVSQKCVWDDEIYESLLASESASEGQSLSEDVDRQLLEFVSQVAYSYEDVQYHSFEHSCVVLMSVDKMLKQVRSTMEFDRDLSPWAKFACLLSALIRNMDLPDVPEFDAPGESAPIVRSKSASKLKSTEKAMHLLRASRFSNMREALCATKSEFRRFWNLVQNLVLATDVSGGSLSARRNKHWEVAFGHGMHHNKSDASPEAKMVSVIEHIVLLAQESHAVQHWENYVKWDNLLLQEYQEEHQKGRLSTDPTPSWRQSQITYFDMFLIPLTQKIDHAGVLGAKGGGFFMYARQNREELASGANDIQQEQAPPSAPDAAKYVNEIEV